jgi:phospholipase C
MARFIGCRKLAALIAIAALFVLVPSGLAFASPIKHVVILYQENHTFDNVLGKICGAKLPCDAATTGQLPDGTSIPLSKASDIVPAVRHNRTAQTTAIDGGQMDGFANVHGCTAADSYACYSQFVPSQIPNLNKLATHFAVSDRTFEMDLIPTWGAHLELVAQQLDGFTGSDNPSRTDPSTSGQGYGCDSQKDGEWAASPTDTPIFVPSCVPDYALDQTAYPYGGAYRQTPVQHVPTIMDELDASGLNWRIYGGTYQGSNAGYGWAICPTFADCLYTPQARNAVASKQVKTDAANGTLPAFSIVIPMSGNSQHNGESMKQGDNWIGSVVSAIEKSPTWNSTAIFITWDDCGCFYAHVAPPSGLGIRVPMVIVSPWARPRYVDSNVASFSSLLAFTEHTLGVPALSDRDAGAYDYSNAFNFQQAPTARVAMVHSRLSRKSRRAVRKNAAGRHGDT